ncbi:unnamed protein product [Gongylonema pulchrum]|uniref:Tr-type G domain-containing protein n=1 Tax=Gongylonema pulchrum TaxID=637853 RepID=A0A183EQI0_9BILA|nr:unnamed protein product [Gongylonema pulchrum]
MGSTAAFDKHAKSAHLRANTIDLGYSTLRLEDTTIALIDCPGHASLISKGIEQQTAEHLLIVSLLCPKHVILVINKIDLIDEETLEQLTRRCKKAMSSLKISDPVPVVSISLKEGKEQAVEAVLRALRLALYAPQRCSSGRFVMFVDHCFPVKGKGAVMTGTVVDGACR